MKRLVILLTILALAGCGVLRGPSNATDAQTATTPQSTAPMPSGGCRVRGNGLFSLPDPRCTPGALNPAVNQGTIGRTICVHGWTKTIRPPTAYTEPLKRAQMKEYGFHDSLRAHEEDHLVPLSLGGAPSAPANLWPEIGATPNPKDRLESVLRRLVCSDRLPLVEAQNAIAGNWVDAYHRYVR